MVNTQPKQEKNNCKSCDGVEKEAIAQKDSQKDLSEKVAQEVNEIIGKVLKKGKKEIKEEILDKYKKELEGKLITITVEIVPDRTSQTELSNISSNGASIANLSNNLATTRSSVCNRLNPFYCIDKDTGEATPCTQCCPNGV